MKTLYTLAFPVLSSDDSRWIEACRREHDPHFTIVEAHFTMVFGCSAVAEDTYMAHVEAVARAARQIPFVCRYAMLGADDKAIRAYVYLVPDEGYSGLSLLHDGLYKGPLSEHLRLDIPFVPHITIGASDDRVAAKRVCDDLNVRGLTVAGVVDSLTVATIEEQEVRKLKTVDLVG